MENKLKTRETILIVSLYWVLNLQHYYKYLIGTVSFKFHFIENMKLPKFYVISPVTQ